MIINRKKRKQALLRILACQIIASAKIDDVDSFTKMTEHLSDLAYYVGGVNGMKLVSRDLNKSK